MKVGRKNRYLILVKPRLETIRAWKRRGLTEKEIYTNLGISHQTLATYKREHGELLEVLKSGKADADAQVESALFKRALGYEYEETKTYLDNTGTGKGKGKAKVEKTTKKVEPNVTAQIFYLKNRCSDRWYDRVGHEISGPGGGPLRTSNVVVYLPDNGRNDDKPESL